MLVRKKDILSFYDKVKKLAVSSLEKERYEDAVAYTNAAAEIAYRFNWMYRDGRHSYKGVQSTCLSE